MEGSASGKRLEASDMLHKKEVENLEISTLSERFEASDLLTPNNCENLEISTGSKGSDVTDIDIRQCHLAQFEFLFTFESRSVVKL